MHREWKPIRPAKPPTPPGPRLHWLTFLVLAAVVAMFGGILGHIHGRVLAWWVAP